MVTCSHTNNILGPLQSVVNLTRNMSTISWVAPFSLDLTGVDPDIVYCVEVYNITCGRSLLISECYLMETSYTNDSLQAGHIYEYTVTPLSNVKGASNGTNWTVTGIILLYPCSVSNEVVGHTIIMQRNF